MIHQVKVNRRVVSGYVIGNNESYFSWVYPDPETAARYLKQLRETNPAVAKAVEGCRVLAKLRNGTVVELGDLEPEVKQ